MQTDDIWTAILDERDRRYTHIRDMGGEGRHAECLVVLTAEIGKVAHALRDHTEYGGTFADDVCTYVVGVAAVALAWREGVYPGALMASHVRHAHHPPFIELVRSVGQVADELDNQAAPIDLIVFADALWRVAIVAANWAEKGR